MASIVSNEKSVVGLIHAILWVLFFPSAWFLDFSPYNSHLVFVCLLLLRFDSYYPALRNKQTLIWKLI